MAPAGNSGSGDVPAQPGSMTGDGTDAPAAGSGSEPEAPADAGEAPPAAREDLGVGDGSDVVTIGDSWMNYIVTAGGIEGALDRAGKQYRHYGIAGTTLINGDIPLQYGRAKAAGANIATVIMTGGGNDIMFTGGCNTKEACAMSVMAIVNALDELWTQMADDGVKDVIYIAYSADAGTTPKDTRPDTPPPPPSICLTGRIVCHNLATTDIVMAELVDGIHPAPAANDRIAAALLDMMEMGGVRR